MKTLILDVPPAALYVIIAACAIIVISGVAVAVYLSITKRRNKTSELPAAADETQPEQPVVTNEPSVISNQIPSENSEPATAVQQSEEQPSEQNAQAETVELPEEEDEDDEDRKSVV